MLQKTPTNPCRALEKNKQAPECALKKKICLVIKRDVRVNRKRALHTVSSPEEERLGRALI